MICTRCNKSFESKDYKMCERCREYYREYKRKWRKLHPESKQYDQDWSRSHPEERKRSTNAYLKRNPHKGRRDQHMRRARKRDAEGSYTMGDLTILYKEQNGRCKYCGGVLDDYHADHMVPLSRGGSNYIENIALACPTCNLAKNNKTVEEFIKLRGVKRVEVYTRPNSIF